MISKFAKCVINLTSVESFTYSAFLRQLRKQATEEQFISFLKIYKNEFDKCIKRGLQEPDKIALVKSVINYNNNICRIIINKKLIKNASITELGAPDITGKNLAEVVNFILKRISAENRSKSKNSLREKIMALNVHEIANKKMPASSSIGHSISFIKQVLFGHDARYIKLVIDNIIKNL